MTNLDGFNYTQCQENGLQLLEIWVVIYKYIIFCVHLTLVGVKNIRISCYSKQQKTMNQQNWYTMASFCRGFWLFSYAANTKLHRWSRFFNYQRQYCLKSTIKIEKCTCRTWAKIVTSIVILCKPPTSSILALFNKIIQIFLVAFLDFILKVKHLCFNHSFRKWSGVYRTKIKYIHFTYSIAFIKYTCLSSFDVALMCLLLNVKIYCVIIASRKCFLVS